MPLPEVFDFPVDNLSSYRPEFIDKLLQDEPELYLNHLRIAQWIDGWVERMREDSQLAGTERHEGFEDALREIAAHLRQGDFTFQGLLFEDDNPPNTPRRRQGG